MSRPNPCPTVNQLLNGVRSLTRQTEGTFQTAWKDSFIDPSHCAEQGGFIYIDFPVPARVTRAWAVFAPPGKTIKQGPSGEGNASIDLNRPGIRQDNVILVANFHTHPLSSHAGGSPHPSKADKENAYIRGIPGIVISRDGVYSYGPSNRESTNNPKGYISPPGSPPSGVVQEALERRPGPPWTVPFQWPEGTGRQGRATAEPEVAQQEDLNNIDDGVDNDELDVILCEWSDEDVSYGEKLEEVEDLIELEGDGDDNEA